MKATQITKNGRMTGKPGRHGRVPPGDEMASLFQDEVEENPIRWPTERQILEIPKRLAMVRQKGIRWEAKGDYFNSGNVAYRLQEIIQATAELFKKSQGR